MLGHTYFTIIGQIIGIGLNWGEKGWNLDKTGMKFGWNQGQTWIKLGWKRIAGIDPNRSSGMFSNLCFKMFKSQVQILVSIFFQSRISEVIII